MVKEYKIIVTRCYVLIKYIIVTVVCTMSNRGKVKQSDEA